MSSEDGNLEVRAVPDHVVSNKTHLTEDQKKDVKVKVQSINSAIPICVALMRKFHVSGSFDPVSLISVCYLLNCVFCLDHAAPLFNCCVPAKTTIWNYHFV